MSVAINDNLLKRIIDNRSSDHPAGMGNTILYKMVETYPRHDDPLVTSDKIWLIGRSYAAAVERGVPRVNEEDADKFYEQLGELFRSNNIDDIIEPLRRISMVSEENAESIIEAHHSLVGIVKERTKRVNRSFVSKYLHFHVKNAVFIYDSRAVKGVKEKFSGIRSHLGRINPNCDGEYKNFFARALRCKHLLEGRCEEIGLGRVAITPRELDQYLLEYKIGA